MSSAITACPDCGKRSSEDYDGRGACWECCSSDPTSDAGGSLMIEIDPIEEFAAVDEAGADPLLGDADNILIPENGDVMFYGKGGASKTTLTFDLAVHLAAGKDWLGIPIPRPVRVLVIENEGPRPLLRKKLRRKLAAWTGPEINGRVRVLRSPWGSFTFADEQWRAELARVIDEQQIDVIVAGPLTRIGMDSAGTLQEVAAFMAMVGDVRAQCDRRLTLILVHHENKGGAVSGAWEGAGDTLLHAQAAGPGHTIVYVQKARWASEYHGTTLKLVWTDGEGFELELERDLLGEILSLLSDGTWRTIEDIREECGARTQAVREVLTGPGDRFEKCTGEDARALGRSAKAQLYRVAS
jgi:hypothetical protein